MSARSYRSGRNIFGHRKRCRCEDTPRLHTPRQDGRGGAASDGRQHVVRDEEERKHAGRKSRLEPKCRDAVEMVEIPDIHRLPAGQRQTS